jgi:polar amino acid transport system substrate-binding protein
MQTMRQVDHAQHHLPRASHARQVAEQVIEAATGQTYAEENAPEGAELVEFTNTGDLFSALVSGSVDAILQDQPVNAERARTDDSVELVEEYDTGESYGFAVANEREDGLLQALNDGLQALRDDGRYDEIYDRYFAAE